jgi:hypothetical protein
MGDPELWALMQRVERLRYRAELLERASADQPPIIRDFLMQLADQARQMADQENDPCQQCGRAECCSSCSYRAWALATPLPAGCSGV